MNEDKKLAEEHLQHARESMVIAFYRLMLSATLTKEHVWTMINVGGHKIKIGTHKGEAYFKIGNDHASSTAFFDKEEK